MKVSLAAAVAVTLPILLYQLWSFLAPGDRGEHAANRRGLRRRSRPILFAGGVAFSYFVVLPRALDFLTNFNDDVFQVADPGELLLLVRHRDPARDGLAFQMPIFILALVRLRVLTRGAGSAGTGGSACSR